MSVIDFFKDLELNWKPKGNEPITLPIIGSAALFLQCSYERGTKDGDVLELEPIPNWNEIDALAGKGSTLDKKHRMYLEIVKGPVPFLPSRAIFHEQTELNKSLLNFRIQALDIADVIVSKLKPFRPQDRDDIKAMVDLGLLDADNLIERFKLAMDRWLSDARNFQVPQIISNLHTVQRDFLFVEETQFELPELH